MTLHQDQVARINEWLAAHVHGQCPACGLWNWWQIHDGFHGVPGVSLDTLNLEEGLEFVATTCKRCGYTAFFLTTRMSLGPRPPTADSP
jgi:predicted nucleic-acid-binding Zn-ribbon protein